MILSNYPDQSQIFCTKNQVGFNVTADGLPQMLNTTRIEKRKKRPLRNTKLNVVIIIGKSVKI